MKVLRTLLLHAMLSRINLPPEKKYLRENQLPFMNKALSKAVAQRSKIPNLSLKTELRKIEIIMLSKGIYKLHFCKKVKDRVESK